MRRKVRLFSAIAALGVAIALMAFGVYAASTITYNVNGKVNYAVTDVLVSINTTLSYVQDNAETTDVNEDKIGYTTTTAPTATYAGTNLSGLDTTLTGDTAIQTYDASNVANNVTTGTASLNISFNDSSAWKVDIAISNIQKDKGVTIAVADFAVPDGANFNVLAATTNATVVPAEGSVTLTFYVYLIEPAEIIDNQTFNISLTLEQE